MTRETPIGKNKLFKRNSQRNNSISKARPLIPVNSFVEVMCVDIIIFLPLPVVESFIHVCLHVHACVYVYGYACVYVSLCECVCVACATYRACLEEFILSQFI